MSKISWLYRAALLTVLSAQSMAVTIAPTDIVQSLILSSGVSIQLLLPSGSTMNEFSVLQPLFSSALTDLERWGLEDDLISVTSTTTNLTSHHIAYISCDSTNSTAGYLSSADILSDVFNSALSADVTAIILYSLTDKYCNITDMSSSYSYVYTMTSPTTSQKLLNMINAATDPIHAEIARADNANGTITTSSSNSTSTSSDYDTTPTTAVAMIILYSITGVITALFLGIIIIGAVRAHRHPERYGPRAVMGRARQSRAKGLARAMLDTIPIVKFGDHDDAPKSADVELAGHDTAEEITPAEQVPVIVSPKEETHGTEIESVAAESRPRLSTQSARSGIAPAANTTQPSPIEEPTNVEAPGCSICTEDFQMGEDLRVLPCHHKFHPACIDPWLLNVSGTCPLCRIDLNPQPAETDEGAVDGELAPPLEDGAAAITARRPRIGMRQSFLIGLGMGRVHETSREERLEAIQALRQEQARMRARRVQAAAEEAADERSRSQRFRERFGIRTSRRGQEGESAEDVAATASETGPASADASVRES